MNYDVGDRIEIQGRIYAIVEVNDSPDFALTYITPMCAACNANDVDEVGSFCPGCVTRAMRFVAIRDACNHLLTNDPELRAVVMHDNEEAARNRGYQYITLRDAAHDQYHGAHNDDTINEVRDSAGAIAHVMCHASLYGDNVIV